MKLTRIRVSSFQQFHGTLDIKGLAPGLNLFFGPNESGKSTLVRAIRTAFFERHRTTALDHLQPLGDSAAAPEVTLAFDWQGSHWQLEKRFMKKSRCDLLIDGMHVFGDEAEDRLAALLGYQFAGRGASKAEHWGIPGLLWVEQGAGQDVRVPVGHAGQHLQSALAGSLEASAGQLASSSGDALIRQAESERAALLTGTGRPTGALRDAQQKREALANALAAVDQEVFAYSEQVDRLGALLREQQDVDASRPWEAQRAQADAARQQLQAVEQLHGQQRQTERELEACRRHQRVQRDLLQDFERQALDLATRERERSTAQQRLEQVRAIDALVQQRLDQARAAYAVARETRALARRHALRQSVQTTLDQEAERLTALDSTVAEAGVLRDMLQQLVEQHQVQALDAATLAQLRERERQLATLAIQQQALATRVSYTLDADRQITLGERTLIGHDEVLLLEETTLRIPDVGTLTIKPGGNDVAEALRQQERVQAERDALLMQLGVADIAAADTRDRSAQQLQQQIGEVRVKLEALAPDGIDALQAQRGLAQQRCDQLAAKLAELAAVETPDALPDEPRAEAELDQAEQLLKAAEAETSAQQREAGLAAQARDAADKEWRDLQAQLMAPDRQQREQQARAALTDLLAQEKTLAMQLQERQREIDAANPALLAQDLERYNLAAAAMQQQATQRSAEILELQTRLQTQGALGLEERQSALRQQHDRAQARVDELDRRAQALDLLLTLLREQRQAVTRRLQAPLQHHLQRYLTLLFPGAELSIDKDLKPLTLRRLQGGQPHGADLDALSYGAREQMGLISRLAYADLLRDAERPTLIMLDDALVHCDQRRRAHMKRILFDAAQRHQILLFTCHPEHWQDLGVAPRDLQTLKAAGG